MLKATKTIVLFLIASSILFPNTIRIHSENETREKPPLKPITIDLPLYTIPINITSDDDFIMYGFPGNGTEELPYIIESFDIETSSDYGIYIKGTSKHFIIKNGYVDAYKSGIRIENVASNTTTIQNCFSFRNTPIYAGSGIEISNSDYCQIQNNTCYGNDYGIRVSGSDYTLLEENNCSYNFQSGIRVGYSSNIRILENIVTNNMHEGMDLYELYFSNISGNLIRNNFYGIYSYDVFSCNITCNLIIENQKHGIKLGWSDNNLVYHNKFISNNIEGESQAYDSSHFNTNLWYNNKTNKGNYWDDFKNSGFSYKYKIEGEKAIDAYPLDENLELIEQIYSNLILGIVLLVYLILLSLRALYSMKRDNIQMRIQRYKNRIRTRKSEPIDRDYDKLVDEEYEKTRKKMLLRGR